MVIVLKKFFLLFFIWESKHKNSEIRIIAIRRNFTKILNYFPAVFISFCDLEKDSLASFDVKIAAACLVVHCGAYSSACSGSEIEVEWSGTVVAVFDNAVFGWDWFFHWYIIIGRCESDQKSQHWNDFHVFMVFSYWIPSIFQGFAVVPQDVFF